MICSNNSLFPYNSILYGIPYMHGCHPAKLSIFQSFYSLFKMFKNEYDKYHLTPKQTRRLFDEKNWVKVVGFHTRNVIHRAHEFIQLSSLEKGKCDGIFIHPVIGMKKTGDYHSSFIIKSYEIMQKEYYPDNKVVFGVFSTYSRYAGEREAIFTALCRKNYGCSAFIIGRDHTGIGRPKNNSWNIFCLSL